jgi:hypothetical protein
VAELRIELAAAQEAYRQAADSYKAGTATNLEALIAQNQLLRAQVQLASQEYIYKVTYLTLLRVVGRLELNDPTGPKIAPPASGPTTMPTSGPSTQPTSQPSGSESVSPAETL